jgi:HAD superfamily hydrolase (TIGR01509 family)
MQLPDRVSAVVFDCDGLLLDTETAWGRAETALFAENGFPFGPDQKALLLGSTIPAAATRMAEYFDRPGEEEALTERLLGLVATELGTRIDAMPGALELVTALAGRIPIGVASNSPRMLLDEALVGSGFARHFTVTVAADEVEHAKPHPDLYLEAFRRLGADPTAGVTLEDSATGATAARASGAFVVAVPSLPGSELPHDLLVTSLADPIIQAWAHSVTVAEK